MDADVAWLQHLKPGCRLLRLQVLHTLHVAESCRIGDRRNILQVWG